MRIVLVGPTHPHRGGITHYTHALANALDAAGAQVDLLSFDRLFPRLLYKGAPVEGEPLLPLAPGVALHRLLSYRSPASWRRARKLLAGADALHLQVWTGFLAPPYLSLAKAARRLGVPVVATLHNVSPHERSHRVFAPLVRRLLRHADCVVLHTPSLRERASARFGLAPEQAVVIPHGRYEHFRQGRVGRDEARRRLGLHPGQSCVLMFGTVRPYKGLATALEVLARLPAAYVLLVAGEPWEDWAPYTAAIERLGLRDRVLLHLRYIPDEEVETFFVAADALLAPYQGFEGQSGVLQTAAAFHLPSVVSPALRDGAGPGVTVAEDVTGYAQALLRAHREAEAPAAPAPDDWASVAAATLALYRDAKG